MSMQQDHALAAYLRACGHFLYYQTGAKYGQRRILVTLLKRESLSQRELQDTLDITSGALSEILQKMEDSSLVERQKNADDKRQVRLTLTRLGRQQAMQMKAHYSRTLERMFECLSDEEKADLSATLEKLVAHLDEIKCDPLFQAGPGCACGAASVGQIYPNDK